MSTQDSKEPLTPINPPPRSQGASTEISKELLDENSKISLLVTRKNNFTYLAGSAIDFPLSRTHPRNYRLISAFIPRLYRSKSIFEDYVIFFCFHLIRGQISPGAHRIVSRPV